MKQGAYYLFDTSLGSCEIAWSEGGNACTSPAVTLLQLPEATTEMTESRIAQNSGARKSSAPPPQIADVIKKVCKHLQGEVQDFRDIAVDLDDAGPFARQVYEAAGFIHLPRKRTGVVQINRDVPKILNFTLQMLAYFLDDIRNLRWRRARFACARVLRDSRFSHLRRCFRKLK